MSMKEQILRMPQGTNKSGGGVTGGGKGTKARTGSLSGSATRTKTVSDRASVRRIGSTCWGGEECLVVFS